MRHNRSTALPATLAGIAIAVAILTAASCSADTDTKADKQPTATIAPTPARSSELAQTVKPARLDHRTSFSVTFGKSTKHTYKVTYNYGDLTAFSPNVSASTFSARPLGDTVLGAACKIKKNERVIPFSINMQGVSGDVGVVHVWLMPVLNKGKQELSPPKGNVRVEYTGFNGKTICNKNATLGTPTAYGFNGPTSKKFSSDVTGWLILSGKALDAKTGYKMAVISSPEGSPMGKTTVHGITGGKPYATTLADGSRHSAGSSVPLTPTK